MDIKAVKFRKDGFYSQPFVFGGEEGQEKFDKNIRYRGSLSDRHWQGGYTGRYRSASRFPRWCTRRDGAHLYR